jgi:ferric-dicitrate binding protein FerR (iron transport regulator)
MPRRKSKNPDQLSLAIALPSARATRAELVDEVKKRTKRRFRHFSSWPKTGVKLLVLWTDGWREGVVWKQHWHPGKGDSVTVRLLDGAEIEVDELRALGPLEE